MKLIIHLSLVITLCVSVEASAQNLVTNPGFEIFSPCPDNIDQVNRATGWSAYLKTPDYFHNCANDTLNSAVPKNFLGYQYPHGGDAYAGFWTYSSVAEYREIIGSKLIAPLKVGTTYQVSFWTVFSDHVAYGKAATNNMGIKFSTIPYSLTTPPPINNSAHLYAKKVITDSLNWTKISGTYIADSAYQYIMLGNFFDNAHTDTTRVWPTPAWFSYYFVDDIEVIEAQSGNIDEFDENDVNILNTLSGLYFTILNPKAKLIHAKVYDVQGKIVDEFEMSNTQVQHSIESYPSGMYILHLSSGAAKVRTKIFKN